MIFWSDIGIVLSSRKYGEKYKMVDIFTKDHGKFSAMFSISKTDKLSIFSNVEINYSSKNENSIGFWKVREEKQNWIYLMNYELQLLICQSICHVLNKALPIGVHHKNLFEFTLYISKNLHELTKIKALDLYSYFEFILLHEIGFGLDLDKCCICGKHEEIKYISPKTCNGASYNCAQKFNLDLLFEVPDNWKKWKTGTFSYTESLDDIKKSLNITGAFISKNINHSENYFRSSIVEMF